MTPFEPMIPFAGRRIFDSDEWSFELMYDGFRALLVIDELGVHFKSKRGSDLNKRLPELEQIGKSLKVRSVVLDGEVIAGDGSIASFRSLLHRYSKFGITTLRPKERVPVKYVAFDVLLLNGAPFVNEPFKSRQQRLRKLIPKSTNGLVRAKSVIGAGSDLHAQAESRGFEGVIAKRLDSIYEPGKRSRNWLKVRIKVASTDETSRRNGKSRKK